MSDFDKEAEREKLREKYERDQEKREVAEKMSELLLQGATMTNAHCSECGDPIFRYDGQEFCATCEKPVDRDTGDAESGADGDGDKDKDEDETDADADGEGDPAGGSETIEVTSPTDNARVQFGGDADETDASTGGQSADESGVPGADTPEDSPGSPVDRPADDPADGRRARRQQPAETAEAAERARRPGGSGSGTPAGATGDVSAARASLVRTLTRFSESAEACEDPGRAREHLAAAREAAEALSALRR